VLRGPYFRRSFENATSSLVKECSVHNDIYRYLYKLLIVIVVVAIAAERNVAVIGGEELAATAMVVQ
jgi:hypothetical protein